MITTMPQTLTTSAGAVTFRPLRLVEDAAAIAELISTANAKDGIDWLPSAEVIAHEIGPNPGFDPASDAILAEAGGTVVGLVAEDWRVRSGKVVHNVEIWTRPSARRRGIGAALLEWAESHARATAAAGIAGPGDLPRRIGGWGDREVPGHERLAARHGYTPFRYGFDMRRPVAGPIPEAPLPAGLEVRPVVPAHHRAIWDADTEAFQDHFEPAVRTDEDFERWFSAPGFDTSLWQVAWDGDEVAGSVLTSLNAEENERLGVRIAWLDHVSVRPPWRRRGLAAALIVSTLRLLQDRDADVAGLGVDAENPTGALRLYERLGFRQHRSAVHYRKAL